MGITGLLPFLEKSSKKTNIKQFAGKTVAIDSYCWLHKGVFSCAEKLSLGQPTDTYVIYCMKFVNMLLSHNIKPILVFDGRHLPAKADTETKRRQKRQVKRHKAAELIRAGQITEGKNLLRQSIDVTHEIALELIKKCQNVNIDCIVAPYEADAQLAYLNISGIADVVITEDSDLILFGCKKVFFKMDLYGNGVLVEQEQLHIAMGEKSEEFDMNKFLYMCILSGCDYLPSLPGIGLIKAKKFITLNGDSDIHRALTRLGAYLKMKSLIVPIEYRDAFILAVVTFKHQLVFCPLQRKQTRLNPPTPEVTQNQLHYAGDEIDPNIALQIAYGNCDPFTFQMLHNFDPDKPFLIGKQATHHISIWSDKLHTKISTVDDMSRKDIANQLNITGRKTSQTNYFKQSFASQNLNSQEYKLSENDMLDTYKYDDSESIKTSKENMVQNEMNSSIETDNEKSPILVRRTNPFCKTQTNKVSPSLLFKGKNYIRSKNLKHLRRTIIDETIITESKFFANSVKYKETDKVMINNATARITNTADNKDSTKNEEIDFNYLKVADKVAEAKSMDIDENEHDISLTEDKLNILNKYIREESANIEHIEDLNPLNESKCSLTLSNIKENVDSIQSHHMNNCPNNLVAPLSPTSSESDYLISQNSINDLQYNFCMWSSTKTDVKSVKPIERRTLNFQANSENKHSTPKGLRRSKQLSSVQKQQSLLSMYGFQKKSNLKH